MRYAVLLLLFTCSIAPAQPPKTYTGPWDLPALQKTEVKPEWGNMVGKVREVYYAGEPYQGKPTRVFAYYARQAEDGIKSPAVLLVHGGGGKAFEKWVEHWGGLGYSALAMDLAGNGPKGHLPDGGPDQSDDTKFKDFDDTSARDMWTYHAIANIIRGYNLLASFPEVDANRIAITGISWGGYLTCIAAGLDDRLKAAVPVYGCGFLHENSAWKPRLDGLNLERRTRWVNAFDPSKYLPGVKCPILFLNGTNDFAYPLDSYKKCYDLVKSSKALAIGVRRPHGHIWTFREVDAFIESHLRPDTKKPLSKISPMQRDNDLVSAAVSGEVKLKSGVLNYAVATGEWQKRDWKTIPAELKDGQLEAKLPAERPLVYYLAVTDERGLEVSTPHEEAKEK